MIVGCVVYSLMVNPLLPEVFGYLVILWVLIVFLRCFFAKEGMFLQTQNLDGTSVELL